MSAFPLNDLLASSGTSLTCQLSPTISLTHGTSPSLISSVSSLLSSFFSSIDSEADHAKWHARDNCEVYYFLLSSDSTPACAVRAILDRRSAFDYTAGISKPLRVVIDYTFTKEEFRGRGLANKACAYVLNVAQIVSASVFVLALEESCPWWMESYGFVLEEGDRLNARFNIFPDTHLLKLGGGPNDEGHERDIELKVEHADSDDDDDDEGDDDVVPMDFTSAVSLLSSSPIALARIRVILNNLLVTDIDPRHRKIKSTNKIIAQEVLSAPGAFDLLISCGWEINSCGGGEEGGGQGLELVFQVVPPRWLQSAVTNLLS